MLIPTGIEWEVESRIHSRRNQYAWGTGFPEPAQHVYLVSGIVNEHLPAALAVVVYKLSTRVGNSVDDLLVRHAGIERRIQLVQHPPHGLVILLLFVAHFDSRHMNHRTTLNRETRLVFAELQ